MRFEFVMLMIYKVDAQHYQVTASGVPHGKRRKVEHLGGLDVRGRNARAAAVRLAERHGKDLVKEGLAPEWVVAHA